MTNYFATNLALRTNYLFPSRIFFCREDGKSGRKCKPSLSDYMCYCNKNRYKNNILLKTKDVFPTYRLIYFREAKNLAALLPCEPCVKHFAKRKKIIASLLAG